MAHPTRGHRSGTYEIQELVAVDPDDLSITHRTAAAYQPQTRRLTSEPTVAARPLLQAMADRTRNRNVAPQIPFLHRLGIGSSSMRR